MNVGRLLTRGFPAIVIAVWVAGGAERGPRPTVSVRQDGHGKLVYGSDDVGNRVIDFSPAGYRGGGESIPFVPAKIIVEPGANDRARIQAAIALVEKMPVGADGFRGAVLLKPGRFVIDGTLRLASSGVVVRGSGEGENGTLLFAAGVSRRTLIEVGGSGTRTDIAASRQSIVDPYVPVGARAINVADARGFSIGSRVAVRRPSTAAWIAVLGMNTLPGWRPENRVQWAPGSRDIVWDRTVTGVDGNRLTLDAPLTTALDRDSGGGTVARYEFPGRIDHVGIEHLRCVSDYDRTHPLDEEHSWVCISLDRVEDAWVRQVTAEHFVSYVVNAQADSRSITIEDCTARAPVSELAGYRRRVFSIAGQLTLVQRCTSEHGLHDFTTGFVAAGPNVFLNCTARDALDHSGPIESWASGVLYDNVMIRGNALRFLNRGTGSQGSGWTTANSIAWNCESTELQVQGPVGAPNQAYGCKAIVTEDNFNYDPARMPARELVRGMPVSPASLYLAQLAERKGSDVSTRLARVAIATAPGDARALTNADVQTLAEIETRTKAAKVPALRVENAEFTIGAQRAWTSTMNYSWYLGQMPRPLARNFGAAITRFAPGENGTGLTDRLEEVVAALAPGAAFVHHYGLWYDRRRINHNLYGSPELTADDATAPFMEQPWARSGEGRDWNGLSKYDLTRFNPWFFQRVKDFADLCDANGRILYHNFYFQHALQETRAHYVDFPWRPVNCIQDTGMPDENPAGSTFYDLSHPLRRELHRRYIRHCLDVLRENTNVVYGIDREYSGPLPFVQFWLDTIAEWERDQGRKVFVCLEVPKAEMDAILSDPVRGRQITAIDFHHWFYRPDGSLFAIEGGINRAPREQQVNVVSEAALAALRPSITNPQHQGSGIVNAPEFQRLTQTIRASTPALRYRARREYRDAFPDLVILRRADDFPALSAAIDQTIPAASRAEMRAAPLVRNNPETSWCMAAPGKSYLVYTMAGKTVELDLTGDSGAFRLSWLDSSTGQLKPGATLVAGKIVSLAPPAPDAPRPWVAWLERR